MQQRLEWGWDRLAASSFLVIMAISDQTVAVPFKGLSTQKHVLDNTSINTHAHTSTRMRAHTNTVHMQPNYRIHDVLFLAFAFSFVFYSE